MHNKIIMMKKQLEELQDNIYVSGIVDDILDLNVELETYSYIFPENKRISEIAGDLFLTYASLVGILSKIK